MLFSRKMGEFFTIVNNSVVKPPIIAHMQTDGSFRYNDKISRTATILNSKGQQFKNVKTYFTHQNSEESEWCSILDGVLYAKARNVKALRVENDNLSVINSLISERPPKSKLERYYFSILHTSSTLDWLDIRWIPREFNRADDLFKIM